MSETQRVVRVIPLARSWRAVEVAAINTATVRRGLNQEHVDALSASFQLLGGELLIQPIVVDETLMLIDGLHRLEAAKQLGWRFVSAVVFERVNDQDRALLLAEANRVRKQLSVVDLEWEWRTLYAPELEFQAKQRQLAGLRKRFPLQAQRVSSPLLPVIGNSNNQEKLGAQDSQPRSESLARAAKRITGFSLDTLNKVATIRRIANSTTAPTDLQAAAKHGLQKIASSRASVDAVYRQLLHAAQVCKENSARAGLNPPRARQDESLLERLLVETSLLAERMAGSAFEALSRVEPDDLVSAQLIEGVRSSLSIALAHVSAAESMRHREPARELRRIITEAGQLCTSIAHERISNAGQSSPVRPMKAA